MTRKVRQFSSVKPSEASQTRASRRQHYEAEERIATASPPASASASTQEDRQSEPELIAARICDSILEHLNRIGFAHAGSGDRDVAYSTLAPIASSVPVIEEVKKESLGDVQEQTRQWLLQQLRGILEIAMQRVTNPKTPTPDRIKWSRIVIAAGQALNGILRDVEIDELRHQINELRTLTLERLSEDEQGEDQRDQTGTSETETSD